MFSISHSFTSALYLLIVLFLSNHNITVIPISLSCVIWVKLNECYCMKGDYKVHDIRYLYISKLSNSTISQHCMNCDNRSDM